MRTRLLVVAAVVLVAVVAGALALVVLDDDEATLTAEERDLVAEASGSTDPLEAVADLAADPERWERLVAAGGTELAAVLDRAQPALGGSDAAATTAAAVVAPLLDDRPVDAEVLPALGRWTWPLLVDVGSAARDVLGAADRSDEVRAAVTGGVVLARTHRLITSPEDGFDAIEAWRADLASAAVDSLGSDDGDLRDRTSALVDGDLVDLPAAVARGVLAAWGEPTDATAPLRDALAVHQAGEPVRAGSVRTIAAYIAVIDDTEDSDAGRAAAELAEDADDLVALEDALLGSDDPSIERAGRPATLLLAA